MGIMEFQIINSESLTPRESILSRHDKDNVNDVAASKAEEPWDETQQDKAPPSSRALGKRKPSEPFLISRRAKS